MCLEHRRGGLFELEDKRVPRGALEQHDEGPQADAADADHLVGDVDDLEPLEEKSVGVGQRARYSR